MDIIPEMGDWVCCSSKDLGPGKVTRLNHDRQKCTADFLVEPDFIDGTQIEEDVISFSRIERIITDPDEIKELEKEYAGE